MLRDNYFEVERYDTFKVRRDFDEWIEPVSDPEKKAEIERLVFETQLSKFLESSKTDRTFWYTISVTLARKKR